MSSTKGKGKARAESPVATSSTAFTPPRTPPRRPQPPISTPANTFTPQAGPSATPISPATPFTPSSKRKSQSRITSFFPCKKPRIEIIPCPPSPSEKKAARLAELAEKKAARLAELAEKSLEDDLKAFIEDINKEDREKKKALQDAAKATRAAALQQKRDARLAAALHRKNVAHWRATWIEWRTRNSKPYATFQLPPNYPRSEYKNVGECRQEFCSLTREDLHCLEHCRVVNPLSEEYADMKLYRVGDVEGLVGRKEAMLAGIEGSDEGDVIARGMALFMEKKKGRNGGKEVSAPGR